MRMRALLKMRETQLALCIVGMIVLVGGRAPVFVTPASLANLLTDSTLLIMLALAQMLVIVTRGVDLSMASSLALAGMMSALLAARFPDLPRRWWCWRHWPSACCLA
jgi:rhamnose transport system permease protein